MTKEQRTNDRINLLISGFIGATILFCGCWLYGDIIKPYMEKHNTHCVEINF